MRIIVNINDNQHFQLVRYQEINKKFDSRDLVVNEYNSCIDASHNHRKYTTINSRDIPVNPISLLQQERIETTQSQSSKLMSANTSCIVDNICKNEPKKPQLTFTNRSRSLSVSGLKYTITSSRQIPLTTILQLPQERVTATQNHKRIDTTLHQKQTKSTNSLSYKLVSAYPAMPIDEPYIVDNESRILSKKPELIFDRNDWNFAIVHKDNQQYLVALLCDKLRFTIHENPLEVLFEIIRSTEVSGNEGADSPLRQILRHPYISIICEENLISYIFEKKDGKFFRITNLSHTQLLDILNFVHEKRITLRLKGIDESKYPPQIEQLMLKIDPSLAISNAGV